MKFIYTAELNFDKDNLVDLLQLADLFQVTSLKDELIKYLLENLEVFDVEKLIKIFYLSDNLKHEKKNSNQFVQINNIMFEYGKIFLFKHLCFQLLSFCNIQLKWKDKDSKLPLV